MITIDARWIHTSGIGTYLRHVIPGIVERFGGHKITLLGNTQDLQKLLGEASRVCAFVEARAAMYSIREQIDYSRLIPRKTNLYFSTHYNVPLSFSGPMLVTVYDLMHLAMPQFARGLHKRLYAKFMFAAVRRKADSIITISEFTKRELVRLNGAFRQPITPIHLGVDESWYSIPRVASPHPRPYVLCVGNVKPHKNLTALVAAFARIAPQLSHDLVLVGKRDGFITGDPQVISAAGGLGERVQFTGWLDDDHLRQYFAHADALAFPSLYEGFGFPPLEAMAAGCPALVSNVSSMPEICGDAALYCDPWSVDDIAAKLMRLLTDAALRHSLRARGLERARGFSWRRCINQTCDVIDSLLVRTARLP